MFGGKKNSNATSRDQQQEGFVKSLLTASSLLSIAVLILIAPDFYHHTKDFVWGFLASRYPAQLLPIAFFCLYAAAYPAMFFLARASWTTSTGVAVLWIADKII